MQQALHRLKHGARYLRLALVEIGLGLGEIALKALCLLSAKVELVRDVGPGSQPLTRHEWDNVLESQ
jgi:hypothetical protein